MEKPVYLKEDTWRFLREALERMPEEEVPAILRSLGYPQEEPRRRPAVEALADNPGPFLAYAGIMARADLLEYTVVADLEGLEYVIDREAAGSIARGGQAVLHRLYDRKDFLFDAAAVAQFVRGNGVFDQLSETGR